MLDDGNLGFLADALNQTFTATGNDDVYKLFQGDQVAHSLTVCGLHQLHSILRQTTLRQGLLYQLRQGFIGINRF
jgi:hypothetical protein